MQDKLNNKISDEILEQIKALAYEQGIKDTLNELSDLYDEITETDLWGQYMTNKEASK